MVGVDWQQPVSIVWVLSGSSAATADMPKRGAKASFKTVRFNQRSLSVGPVSDLLEVTHR